MKNLFLSLIMLVAIVNTANAQSFTLPGDGDWYLVATKGGRHAVIEYTYSHSTAHNPSIASGRIQFINAKTFMIQDHQTMGYNAWNQLQFAVINKGNTSELWVRSTAGVNSGVFEITYQKSATLVLGATSDNNLSDNGGSLKVYDKLRDNSHTMVGNVNVVDGKLGVGTTSFGSHKMAVEGSIGAREIKVEINGWSDFVFEEDYELKTLDEVAEHIADKGHLPDIPSESEVMKNGINVGEMNAKLLQKIEELTLYLIDQNKALKVANEKIEALQKEVKDMKEK